jgi:hypothetical protein
LVFFEYEHEPGTFGLSLSLCDMTDAVADVFEEFGQEGGGYGWEAVARSALQAQAPQLADRLDFDPEGSMFMAYGEDAEALKELGLLLQQALRDRSVLRELIEAADPEWFD